MDPHKIGVYLSDLFMNLIVEYSSGKSKVVPKLVDTGDGIVGTSLLHPEFKLSSCKEIVRAILVIPELVF